MASASAKAERPIQKEGLREKKKRITQQTILKNARRLFERHGFDMTSMDAIADASTVSTASLYNYFQSKDLLLASLIAEDISIAIRRCENLLDGAFESAAEAYARLLRSYFEAFDEIDRGNLRRFTAHAILHENLVDSIYFGSEQQLFGQIDQMTSRLEASGLLPANHARETYTRLIFSIANSEFYDYVASDSLTSAEACTSIAAQLALVFGQSPSPGQGPATND